MIVLWKDRGTTTDAEMKKSIERLHFSAKGRFRYTIHDLIYLDEKWYGGKYEEDCPICLRLGVIERNPK